MNSMRGLPVQALKAQKVYMILGFLLTDCVITALLLMRVIGGYAYAFLMIFGFILFCLGYFYLGEKYFLSCGWLCKQGELTVVRGIFVKRRTVVAGKNVSYAKIYRDPVQRHFSLCSLGLFCPGAGRVLLNNITQGEAERIKELLCEEANQGQSV